MQVEKRFKWIWADHGDDISMQYAGTGALKSGFTRTGRPQHREIHRYFYEHPCPYCCQAYLKTCVPGLRDIAHKFMLEVRRCRRSLTEA